MPLDEPRARIGHRGGAISRAKQLALKALVVAAGAVTLASAFVVSLVFVVIGVAVVLLAGGYLWWKTRDLRKQMRAQMQDGWQSRPGGNVIEGEVIRRDSDRRD